MKIFKRIKIKDRWFVCPCNAAPEDEASSDPMADLLSSFGVEQNTEEEPKQTEEKPEADQESETPPDDNSQQDEENKQQEEHPVKVDKQAEAFARMRIENKRNASMLQNIAKVLGVQATDQDSIIDALNEKVVAAQAKQQGVPQEVLQRMQTLEEQVKNYTEMETKKNAYLGFQRVKDAFSLDNDAVSAFADSLIADGLNPFEQELDLEALYLKKNYKTLVQKAIEQGVQQEAARAAKANKSSTVPNQDKGEDANDGGEKVTSVHDLSVWLDKHNK